MDRQERVARLLAPVAQALVPAEVVRRRARVDRAVGGDGQVAPEAMRQAAPRCVLTWWLPGAVAVGTNVAAELRVPQGGALERVDVACKVGPTGSALRVRLRRNGAEAAVVWVGDGETRGGSPVAGGLGAGDYLTIDVTATGGAEGVSVSATHRIGGS